MDLFDYGGGLDARGEGPLAALRLSFILFVIGVEAVVIAAALRRGEAAASPCCGAQPAN